MHPYVATAVEPASAPFGIEPTWLNRILAEVGIDGVVESVSTAPVGTGQVADSYRITVEYASGCGPTTMVGKFASRDAGSAKLGGAGGLYEREVRFYRDLAPHLDMATPRPFAALMGADHAFTLLLEDLSPARSVDQLHGCTPAEARVALSQAAALHAGSWHAAELASQPWLRSMIDGLLHMTSRLPRIFERLEDSRVFPSEHLDVARGLVRHAEPWRRTLERRTALWHQDFRLDNLLFSDTADGMEVAVLDWQTVCFGPSIGDVSLLLGTGLTSSERRANESDLVTGYHAALVERGVKGYSLEECWDGYRLMALHGVFAGIIGAGRVKRTERGDRMWQTWVERHLAQADDLGSWELLARA